MKAYILTIAIAAISFCSNAQTTSGTINYKEIIKLDIELEGDMAQFADMIPKEQIFNKELHFTPEASLYRMSPKKEQAAAPTNNGMHISINESMPEETIYRDLKTKTIVSQKEFMTRKFLVTGEAQKMEWKMTGKQKKILDYPCMEATTVVDSEEISAWFTAAIPVASGPGEFSGLPGMIMEVNMGEMYSLVATDVKAGEVDNDLLVKPKGGKKMSSAEYKEMVAEKRKEMAEQMGGEGDDNVIIRVRTN